MGKKGYGPCGERISACDYPDCDCFNSEIIMLSIGYAEVFEQDEHGKGECISGGEVIWREDED